MSMITMTAMVLAVMAQSGDGSITERTEEVEVRLGREDGQNTWSAGDLSGTWGGLGSSRNLFGVSRRNRASADITVTGGSFSDSPLSISCSGGDSELSLGWITFDKQDLVYSCTFMRDGVTLDSRFELALQERGMFGMGRNERAGAFQHDGVSLTFETERLSGVGLPTGRVPGYVIRRDGTDVGGMDYGVMRSRIYLPEANDPLREPVTITAIILALFVDPANMNN